MKREFTVGDIVTISSVLLTASKLDISPDTQCEVIGVQRHRRFEDIARYSEYTLTLKVPGRPKPLKVMGELVSKVAK